MGLRVRPFFYFGPMNKYVLACGLLFAVFATAQAQQNPSPMVEHTRAHERIPAYAPTGTRFTLPDLLPRPVEVLIPEGVAQARSLSLLIHVMGAAFLPFHAVETTNAPHVVAVVNLGGGSRANETPFRTPSTFARLVDALRVEVERRLGRTVTFTQVDLSAFSAGYGAVRAILSEENNLPMIGGVLLLDGLHTSYVPEGKVLAEGGMLDESLLAPFLRFARLAVAGEKRFVITHSEIFPGTFASTTETADYLLDRLGLHRTPVLHWGPMGMQQLSEVRAGRFHLLGFAGNTAPDHVDHLHGLAAFLTLLSEAY